MTFLFALWFSCWIRCAPAGMPVCALMYAWIYTHMYHMYVCIVYRQVPRVWICCYELLLAFWLLADNWILNSTECGWAVAANEWLWGGEKTSIGLCVLDFASEFRRFQCNSKSVDDAQKIAQPVAATCSSNSSVTFSVRKGVGEQSDQSGWNSFAVLQS